MGFGTPRFAAMRHGGPERGFTLLELMVTVTIVGVLAAIALPTYAEYVRRSRIVDATQRLSEARVKNEQYFLDNRTYKKAAGCGADDASSQYFDVVCTAGSATEYLIKATGKDAMAGFEYTVDQTNTRKTTALPSGWSGKDSLCWVTRKDGSCG